MTRPGHKVFQGCGGLGLDVLLDFVESCGPNFDPVPPHGNRGGTLLGVEGGGRSCGGPGHGNVVFN